MLRICNAYCYSNAKMFARTPLNVTFIRSSPVSSIFMLVSLCEESYSVAIQLEMAPYAMSIARRSSPSDWSWSLFLIQALKAQWTVYACAFYRTETHNGYYLCCSLTIWHRSFTFNSNKSPTSCNNFSVYYPDLCLKLNMFRAYSRLSSGAQWLQWQPLVLPSYRGDSRAVLSISIPLAGAWGLEQAGCTYIIMYVCIGMNFIDCVSYALSATDFSFLHFCLTIM
jgi:hypothetical protein